MNTPNPLQPHGSLQKGGSPKNVKVKTVFICVCAIHLVFFGGLLMIGCGGGDEKKEEVDLATALPPMPTPDGLHTTPPPDPVPSPVPSPTPDPYYSTAGQLPGNTLTANPTMTPTTPPDPSPLFADPTPMPPTGGMRETVNPFLDPTPTTVTVDPVPVPMPTEGTGLDPVVNPSGPVYREYVIQSGDSFYSIAGKFGLKTSDVVAANPNVNASRLQIGQKILLPDRSMVTETRTTGSTVGATGMREYKVRPGDNLITIAKKHQVTVEAIKKANKMTSDRIFAGKKLLIPAASSSN